MLFEPFAIRGVEFKYRIVRSSIGGRTSFYDGQVSPAWARFEKRFAEAGVSALISATVSVDERRWSPLEYPKISHDRFIARRIIDVSRDPFHRALAKAHVACRRRGTEDLRAALHCWAEPFLRVAHNLEP